MKIFTGIKNIWLSGKLKIGLLIVIVINVIVYFTMVPSWSKFFVFFGLVPAYLFIVGHMNIDGKITMEYPVNTKTYTQENMMPVHHIEKETITTTTTKTTERIFFNNEGGYIE